MKDIIKNNKISFGICGICIFLIIIITSFVFVFDNLVIDNVVYEFIVNNFGCNFMDNFMVNVTKLGDTKFVILFTGVMFLVFLFSIKKMILSFIFSGSVLLIAFINQVMKFTFRRVRPDVNKLIEIGGYSFPSGHAMVSMILYGLIAYISYRVVKLKWFRNVVVCSNLVIILLIGFSRIYLGVHFFSDIVVGFLTSIIFLVIIINILEKKVFSQN